MGLGKNEKKKYRCCGKEFAQMIDIIALTVLPAIILKGPVQSASGYARDAYIQAYQMMEEKENW